MLASRWLPEVKQYPVLYYGCPSGNLVQSVDNEGFPEDDWPFALKP